MNEAFLTHPNDRQIDSCYICISNVLVAVLAAPRSPLRNGLVGDMGVTVTLSVTFLLLFLVAKAAHSASKGSSSMLCWVTAQKSSLVDTSPTPFLLDDALLNQSSAATGDEKALKLPPTEELVPDEESWLDELTEAESPPLPLFIMELRVRLVGPLTSPLLVVAPVTVFMGWSGTKSQGLSYWTGLTFASGSSLAVLLVSTVVVVVVVVILLLEVEEQRAGGMYGNELN